MAKKQVSVQTHYTYIERVDEVAKNLQDAGMTVQQEIKPIGHFRGTVDEAYIGHLETLPGVAAVTVIGDEGEPENNDYSISNS